MHPLYDKFCKLCEELAIKNKIDPILSDLYAKRDELESALKDLGTSLQKEQADVEKLEGVTVSSVFYTMIGQKERKLEKEKAEAFDAEEKFSEVRNQLDAINEEITKYERELRAVRGCDLRYGRLLPQIIDEIKAIDSPASKAIIDTVDSLTRIEAKLTALDEALALCTEALNNAKAAEKSLAISENYAQSLSLFNAKHNAPLRSDIKINLTQAQQTVDTLCRQIKRLDASLVGSQINFDINIEVGVYPDDISEWKAETDCLIQQIQKVQEKLIPARDRWAKVVEQRRTELHEQIKAVLEV
ncbi:MAG: hypothetical protein IKK01_04305 [Clostridia bacterium]|nr:hypothetical protein [Clostridia bacterium]